MSAVSASPGSWYPRGRKLIVELRRVKENTSTYTMLPCLFVRWLPSYYVFIRVPSLVTWSQLVSI